MPAVCHSAVHEGEIRHAVELHAEAAQAPAHAAAGRGQAAWGGPRGRPLLWHRPRLLPPHFGDVCSGMRSPFWQPSLTWHAGLFDVATRICLKHGLAA